MTISEQYVHNKRINTLSQLPLEHIDLLLRQDDLYESSFVISWLIQRVTLLGASEFHCDWINGYYNMSLRVGGKLKYLQRLSLNQGVKFVNIVKKELQITSSATRQTQINHLVETSIDQLQCKFYIIPFHTLESIIIRFCPQVLARPTWTNLPGINKKIFIWQMGKVGSSTILASLKPYTKKYNWQYDIEISDEPYSQYNNIIHTHSAKPIYHLLHHSDEEFIIISLVRDILQRNVSAVFQSMTDDTVDNPNFIASEQELRKWSYDKLYKAIKNKLLSLNLSDKLTSWYDSLFKSHFYYPNVDRYHIDVYSKPFDYQRGMQIYESKTPRIKLLIIRLEDLNCLTTEIGDFLGVKNFTLCQANIATNKWYKEIYQQFKNMYRPTDRELNNIYKSRFMNYFYGSERKYLGGKSYSLTYRSK